MTIRVNTTTSLFWRIQGVGIHYEISIAANNICIIFYPTYSQFPCKSSTVIYCLILRFPCCLYFLLLRQKKVTKNRRLWPNRSARPKAALRCCRSSLITCVALVLTLHSSTIKLFQSSQVWLLRFNLSIVSRPKKAPS